jgi:hypothetical protein
MCLVYEVLGFALMERKCDYFNEIALRITQKKYIYKLWIVSSNLVAMNLCAMNLCAMNLVALMDGVVMKSPQIS